MLKTCPNNSLKIKLFIALLVICFLIMPKAFTKETQDPLKVTYILDRTDDIFNYQVNLLKLVLDKAGVNYEMSTITSPSSQSRYVQSLISDENITVGWMGTSREFEEKLHPIRIPLMRGLLGYRIPIIHKENQETLAKVRTKEDYLKLTACQGLGWPDSDILKHGGFRVFDIAKYQQIFSIVNINRCDIFPRGAHEPFIEINNHKTTHSNLMVDMHTMITYKFPMFFFVKKDNIALANAIESGFRKAYEDGSFLKFFYAQKVIQDALEKAKLEDRRCLHIDNPYLTEKTKNIPKKYWLIHDDTFKSCKEHMR